jgi:hypothetical protein
MRTIRFQYSPLWLALGVGYFALAGWYIESGVAKHWQSNVPFGAMWVLLGAWAIFGRGLRKIGR